MKQQKIKGTSVLLSLLIGVHHAASSHNNSGKENMNLEKSEPVDSSEIVKRSADGGQRKFQREGKALSRSGGMRHSPYHGDCGNGGTQCGKPDVEFKEPLYDRRP